MVNLGEKAKKLAASLFGVNEVKNRIAKNTMKLLVNDIATLNSQFADAKGQYLTLKEIQNDISLAEEVYDVSTAEFLKKLMNMVQKEDVKKSPVVVMVNYTGLSAHRLDLESLDERIDTLINAVS
jgi:choline kinase